MVDEIRRAMNNLGQVSQLGRSFAWVSSRGDPWRRDLEISVSVRGGRTRITLRENLAPLVGACYGGIGGGMGGGGMGPIMGILFGALGVPGSAIAVIIPLWLAATFATARTTYYYSAKRRERKLEGLADRLAALAQELVPARPARAGNRDGTSRRT